MNETIKTLLNKAHNFRTQKAALPGLISLIDASPVSADNFLKTVKEKINEAVKSILKDNLMLCDCYKKWALCAARDAELSRCAVCAEVSV